MEEAFLIPILFQTSTFLAWQGKALLKNETCTSLQEATCSIKGQLKLQMLPD